MKIFVYEICKCSLNVLFGFYIKSFVSLLQEYGNDYYVSHLRNAMQDFLFTWQCFTDRDVRTPGKVFLGISKNIAGHVIKLIKHKPPDAYENDQTFNLMLDELHIYSLNITVR
jgi:hypothetical protein